MADTTLIVSIVGITTSGVVGPAATAWAQRRSARQQFARERAAKRREDLRTLVDEAAKHLAPGATNARIYAEAKERGEPPPDDVATWAAGVNTLLVRLRLRLPASHDVVRAYERVRETAGEVMNSRAVERDRKIDDFAAARDAFLDASRATLEAPVAERDAEAPGQLGSGPHRLPIDRLAL